MSGDNIPGQYQIFSNIHKCSCARKRKKGQARHTKACTRKRRQRAAG